MTKATSLSIDLTGQRALVTGGTRGIGQAVTTRLAAAGATVLTTARSAPESPDPAVGFVQADVSTAAGAETIASAALDRLGGVDLLVHNAGASFSKPGGTLALTDDDWLLTLNTNLLAAVRLDRLLLPAMTERGHGVIVHTSSVQWRRPSATSPAYAAAKAALTNYSKELATEFGPHGIRVNTIVPGYIETSGARQRIDRIAAARGLDPGAARQALIDDIGGIPLGRPGHPEEVANLVCFLASPLASYVTGAQLYADGGNLPVI
ncbi:MAG: SDR family oxidoreductase [Actinobacteria bacterium]|nr:SDR family oxidoreductase [Actinomycetota bacterium]